MTAGDTTTAMEASAAPDVEAWEPLDHPEWTMSPGWLTLLAGVCLGVCVALGVLTQ